MKKLLIGLLTLGSISVFADQTTYEMKSTDITILNDIVGAVRTTGDAKTFVKNVSFDKISATFSADRRVSIISGEGLLIVGGDMACGNLKITITRSYKRDPMSMGNVTKFTSSLDRSDLSTASYCKLNE
jgi:hypothetical protein